MRLGLKLGDLISAVVWGLELSLRSVGFGGWELGFGFGIYLWGFGIWDLDPLLERTDEVFSHNL